MADEAGKPRGQAAAAGSRIAGLEEEARRADDRLRRLEVASAEMKEDVEMLAEATGGLRQQSAKMKEAALRVAELVQLAAKRRGRQAGQPERAGGSRQGQAERRPPRTK